MTWSIFVRRALLSATLTAYAALIAGVWMASPSTIRELTAELPPALEASTVAYRGVASVLLIASASLVALVGWSWRTRPTRPFALEDGNRLTMTAAATLLRQAVICRSDVRTAEVVVEHRGGTVAASMTLDVTADALLAEIEEHARGAAQALAARVNAPISDLQVAITFEELDLVAARARRAVPTRDQRAA